MPKTDLIRAMNDPGVPAGMDASGIANPLAAMGVDDQQLRRASGTRQLTTAWFCTLNTMTPACGL
jgi:hypothetical protein